MRTLITEYEDTRSPCPKCGSIQVKIYNSHTVWGPVEDKQCSNKECNAIRPESLPECLK